MKNITFTGLPGTWQKRVRVSDTFSIFFNPSLQQLCNQRNAFWSLLFDTALPMGHNPSYWWKMATEAEALIENLTGEYSI